MRLNIVLGIIVVLAALLQGCGHKAPLTLPAPDASPSQQGK
jgi:predicted small lipoprotein YifL